MADEETQSWDEFWAETTATRSRTEIIRGVAVPVPVDLPMRVIVRGEQLSESESLDDVRSLLADVFGADLLDDLVDAGLGVIELRTLLAWAVAQGSGKNLSFRDAYEKVREAEEGRGKDETVVPNRADRRSRGNATGGPSKPTSPASTRSARKTSRR